MTQQSATKGHPILAHAPPDAPIHNRRHDSAALGATAKNEPSPQQPSSFRLHATLFKAFKIIWPLTPKRLPFHYGSRPVKRWGIMTRMTSWSVSKRFAVGVMANRTLLAATTVPR
mmetsp:Transcript_16770/g.29542  ORF Transcript_16770/g.29542 Transcript_16770/m.29542 type:complete len:115 (+) Transcript_16770:1090-1434(+)